MFGKQYFKETPLSEIVARVRDYEKVAQKFDIVLKVKEVHQQLDKSLVASVEDPKNAGDSIKFKSSKTRFEVCTGDILICS